MNRDAKTILQELVEKADSRYLYDKFLHGGRFEDADRNASLVGKLVETLSDEDRQVLDTLSSEEVVEMFSVGVQHRRPEVPVTRKRGPVKLSK